MGTRRNACLLSSPENLIGIQSCRTSFATILRVTGATTKTAGKATAQLGSHDPIQIEKKPGTKPNVSDVEMPDTMQDISPDKIKPNNAGAKRAGNIVHPIM